MNTTNAQAFNLAVQALKAGCILQVPGYTAGTLTAGLNKVAVGYGGLAVHAYFPRGRGNFTRDRIDALECAHILLEHCGRGKLGKAARASLERKART